MAPAPSVALHRLVSRVVYNSNSNNSGIPGPALAAAIAIPIFFFLILACAIGTAVRRRSHYRQFQSQQGWNPQTGWTPAGANNTNAAGGDGVTRPANTYQSPATGYQSGNYVPPPAYTPSPAPATAK